MTSLQLTLPAAAQTVSPLTAAVQRISAPTPLLPARTRTSAAGRYGVIYADPPWTYRVYSKDTGNGRSAESQYKTTATAIMANWPVADLAAPDCVLLMWAVWPSLPDAFELGRAWGFEYKTLAFDWLKRTSTGAAWHMGLGFWTRANSEPCLLFTRGNPHRLSKGVRQLIADDDQPSLFPPIIAPLGAHSAKPHEAYRRIESLLPGPYLELFARNSAPGWDCWGNEATNPIDWQPWHCQ